MSQYFRIHPDNPQKRLINQATDILRKGGIAVFPTDTTYGLGCLISNRKGVERIMQLKRLPNSHQLSILVPDLSGISKYARVDNQTYRLLKRFLPGPYTFILDSTRDVPKSILPKRKTIGLRIPDHSICLALLQELDEPLLSTSFRLPAEDIQGNPEIIADKTKGRVDLIIDGGILLENPSTIVDLTGGTPKILRAGSGSPDVFG
ncbi:MAG: threonylcarbamoyl-AMP synthase [Magnetococcales bacterium]|nr:threonylcarbamoyl-AMP synthase [Magnetococcales bacterium]